MSKAGKGGGDTMTRDEALNLLRGGPVGIAKWNECRKASDHGHHGDLEMGRAHTPGFRIGEDTLVVADDNVKSGLLAGVDLTGAHLSGANLGAAVLRGANLTNTVLRSADLSGADLRGAYLNNADASQTRLIGTRLSGADLLTFD